MKEKYRENIQANLNNMKQVTEVNMRCHFYI